MPWHEDSAYWRTMLDPMEVVTVWLAIDASDEGNGCMYVIPRTQDNGYSEYYDVDPNKNVFVTEIRKGQFDETIKVALILAENEASLHQAKLIHGSPSNTSNRRRTGFTMRYIASSTRLSPENLAKHQLYRARGRDFGVNRYGDPHKTYPQLRQEDEGTLRKPSGPRRLNPRNTAAPESAAYKAAATMSPTWLVE